MVTKNPKSDGYENLFEEHSDEQTSSRIVEVDNRKFTLVQENPFNLWRIIPSSGKVPKDLENMYTSVHLAEQAIKIYLSSQAKK